MRGHKVKGAGVVRVEEDMKFGMSRLELEAMQGWGTASLESLTNHWNILDLS